MKRVVRLLVLAAFLSAPSTVLASGEVGIYVAPKFIFGYLSGYSYSNTVEFDGDNVFGAALALGFDLGKNKNINLPVRLELEYAMLSEAKNKYNGNLDTAYYYFLGGIKTSANTFFVNAYYDIRTGSALTPYLGFGLGMAFLDLKGYGYSFDELKSSETNFAWNVSIGAAYAIAGSPISIDFGYRFVSLGSAPPPTGYSWVGSGDTLYVHQMVLGMRYTF